MKGLAQVGSMYVPNGLTWNEPQMKYWAQPGKDYLSERIKSRPVLQSPRHPSERKQVCQGKISMENYSKMLFIANLEFLIVCQHTTHCVRVTVHEKRKGTCRRCAFGICMDCRQRISELILLIPHIHTNGAPSDKMNLHYHFPLTLEYKYFSLNIARTNRTQQEHSCATCTSSIHSICIHKEKNEW